MSVTVEKMTLPEMFPVTRELSSIKIAGKSIETHLQGIFASAGDMKISVKACFFPSDAVAAEVIGAECCIRIKDADDVLLEAVLPGCTRWREFELDSESVRIRFPWDLLRINERLVGALEHDEIAGTVREGVVVDGHIVLGKGSVLLPGVYIEGNAVIGENCKIGPNCYIRGNTSVGDKCHIGQAVEIKNSLFFDHVSAGHLSYFGDSVVCDDVNFGAGTVASNLRHDGKNHRFRVGSELIDTGRRKFGVVIGEKVHTGIHTSLYPGRSLPPGAETLPGEIVSR